MVGIVVNKSRPIRTFSVWIRETKKPRSGNELFRAPDAGEREYRNENQRCNIIFRANLLWCAIAATLAIHAVSFAIAPSSSQRA